MYAFRILLAALLVAVVVYTVFVVAQHGMNLFAVFFGDIFSMNWPGQFNLDFLGFLTLSGVWMAWRNHFSGLGLVLGVFAFVGGIPLLSTYLLYLSFKTGGDIRIMLLGEQRALQ